MNDRIYLLVCENSKFLPRPAIQAMMDKRGCEWAEAHIRESIYAKLLSRQQYYFTKTMHE